jgi:hypothetical protein
MVTILKFNVILTMMKVSPWRYKTFSKLKTITTEIMKIIAKIQTKINIATMNIRNSKNYKKKSANPQIRIIMFVKKKF